MISDGNKHHALAQGGQRGLDPRAVFGEAQDWTAQTATQDFDRYSEAYTNLNLSQESDEADRARYKVTKSTVKIPGKGVLFNIQNSSAASCLGPVGGMDKERVCLNSSYSIDIPMTTPPEECKSQESST